MNSGNSNLLARANPTPVFAVRNVMAKNVSTVGKHGEHLKLIISDGATDIPAIAFGLGPMSNSMPSKFDLAFNFSENEYRGRKEFQLQVLDLQPI